MNTNIARRFARYIALPIVSAGIIGGAALGLAGMANAATTTTQNGSSVVDRDLAGHLRQARADAMPGWRHHHGVGHAYACSTSKPQLNRATSNRGPPRRGQSGEGLPRVGRKFHRAELVHSRHPLATSPGRLRRSTTPTVGHMGTELPTERLHRRLGARARGRSESESDDDGKSGCRPVAVAARSRRRWIVGLARGCPRRPRSRRSDRAGSRRCNSRARHRVHAASRQNPTGGLGQTASGGDGFDGATRARRAPAGWAGHRERRRAREQAGSRDVDSGARIADALTAAGGALDGADLIGLNMARRVTDGEQIIVGIAAPPGEPTTMGSSVASEPSGPPGDGRPGRVPECLGASVSVDLNTATEEQLDTLPGVGPVTGGRHHRVA